MLPEITSLEFTEAPIEVPFEFTFGRPCESYTYTCKYCPEHSEGRTNYVHEDVFVLYLIKLEETGTCRTAFVGKKGYFKDRLSYSVCIDIDFVSNYVELLNNALADTCEDEKLCESIFPSYILNYNVHVRMCEKYQIAQSTEYTGQLGTVRSTRVSQPGIAESPSTPTVSTPKQWVRPAKQQNSGPPPVQPQNNAVGDPNIEHPYFINITLPLGRGMGSPAQDF